MPLTGGGRWLALPVLFFAGAFAWRDSVPLLAANVGALLAALALLVTRARAGRLRAAGVLDYILGALWAGLHAAAGLPPLVLNDVRWRELPGGRLTRAATAVGCGVLLAAPLLLLFAALFASADPIFGQLVDVVLRWVLDDLLARFFLIALYAWLAGGLLRRALLADDPAIFAPAGRALGALELAVALALIDAVEPRPRARPHRRRRGRGAAARAGALRLSVSTLWLGRNQSVPGCRVLVARRQAREPHELEPGERAAFFEDPGTRRLP